MSKLILAGDVYQYRLYLKLKKLKEENTVFVMGTGDLMGRANGELANMLLVGTWYKREYGNIMPIHKFLQSRGVDFNALGIGILI